MDEEAFVAALSSCHMLWLLSIAAFEANAADVDGRSWTYLAYGPFSDLASYRAWMDSNCLGDDPLFFTVINLAGGQPAGLVSYLNWQEIGIGLVGSVH
jgi:hypothetical protein